MTEEEQRLLRETADEVENETGRRVDIIDLGTGPQICVFGVFGTSPMTPAEARMMLHGFQMGVRYEMEVGNG